MGWSLLGFSDFPLDQAACARVLCDCATSGVCGLRGSVCGTAVCLSVLLPGVPALYIMCVRVVDAGGRRTP